MKNTKAVVQQLMASDKSVVMPLSIEGNCWSGLVIKKQPDGSLQVIYNESRGKPLMSEKNAKSLIAAIMELHSEIQIFDIKCKQSDDTQASGAFTVNNLVKLATTNTSNFHKKNFHDLLSVQGSTSENIEELREAHDKLILDYIMPAASLEQVGSGLTKGGRDAFEQKGGDYYKKDDHVKLLDSSPPPYEAPHEQEAAAVQMHVSLAGDVDSYIAKDVGHA
jgi:hypothetical protein